jgi:hypothetical protein
MGSISLGISLLNIILQKILNKLGQLEKEKTMTVRLNASINKMWMATYINTGLVMLLINLKYDRLFVNHS